MRSGVARKGYPLCSGAINMIMPLLQFDLAFDLRVELLPIRSLLTTYSPIF